MYSDIEVDGNEYIKNSWEQFWNKISHRKHQCEIKRGVAAITTHYYPVEALYWVVKEEERVKLREEYFNKWFKRNSCSKVEKVGDIIF